MMAGFVVQRAAAEHAPGISRVCSVGWRDTYELLYPQDFIERIIREFYDPERILREITGTDDGWDGWFVALDGEEVVGAIGGGMTGAAEADVYVLYVLPARRGEGIGTLLLDKLTGVQRAKGAVKQWVSVAKGNEKGIPFYEARGFVKVGEQKLYAGDEDEDFRACRYVRDI